MQILALKKLFLQTLQNDGLSQQQFNTLTKDDQNYLEKKGEKYFLKKEFRKLIKLAMTGGVFDIIHPGHILTLDEAKKYGDVLIVVVATDQNVKKIKKREPLHSQTERLKMVNALKPVDLAIPGGVDWRQTLAKVSPDVVIFGYDQIKKEIPNIKTIQLTAHADYENSKTGKIREKLGI